jgi:hypothetical protein
MEKGLPGGAVAAAGSGGMGGTITIQVAKMLTINIIAITADGADGGNQAGAGGKGGDSDASGGKGGDVGKTGDGGDGGTIAIKYKTLEADSSLIDATANGGEAGNQSGMPGAGGKPNESDAGMLDPTPVKPGNDGKVIINGVVQ